MIVPCLRAATIASFATSGVVSLSAQKMPPVWNQREPSLPKIASQSICPGFSWLTAVCPRSEQPNAARTPNPRSVKFNPLRVVRPTPSYFAQTTCDWSTPPCSIRSSSRRPTGLSARAVTMAVFNPKHRRSPRATLYSPPPSHTLNWRAVATRRSPGSSRSITSPRLTRSHLHWSFGRITRSFASVVVFVTPASLSNSDSNDFDCFLTSNPQSPPGPYRHRPGSLRPFPNRSRSSSSRRRRESTIPAKQLLLYRRLSDDWSHRVAP